MEIVSRPDMRSPAEAGAYLRKLRAILRYVGSCDGNMEEGSMRADVNVSVRKPGGELGTRTETKNVNSVRFVMAVIEHEAKRQVELIEGGGTIAQETRLFDPDKGVTRSLRSKEDAHDYRYFPDPDLLPLELDDAFLEDCRASLPELPDAKRKRYEGLGITPYNASVLTAEVETARWFDALLDSGRRAQAGAPTGSSPSCSARSTGAARRIDESPVSPAQAAELLELVADGTISGTIAKQVFEIMLETGEGAGADRRGARPQADQRHRRDRRRDRQDPRRQRRQGRRVQGGKAAAVRLLRRPDDEGDGRQGQPAGRQRAAAGEAGLTQFARIGSASCVKFLLAATRGAVRLIVVVSGRGPAAFDAPKLLVVISVDQFSADLFDEYRPHFTGGLARLATGTVFHNGYQSHAATETCPGHSTILTGDHPARTGIIANIWIDQSVGARPTRASIAPRTRASRAPARSPTRSRPGICACRRSASG